MPDYPARVIPGGTLLPSRLTSVSRLILGGVNSPSNSKSTARLVNTSSLLSIESPLKIYFNNGFSQDAQNIYLSKSALGLPVGLNLSLEAFFVACLLQWAINLKNGDDQKITSQYLAYADKQGSYIYFTVEVTLKVALSAIDDYELQPVYTLSPLDF
jgi:hypothetical protein